MPSLFPLLGDICLSVESRTLINPAQIGIAANLARCLGQLFNAKPTQSCYRGADVAAPLESGTSVRIMPSCLDVMKSSPSRLRLMCRSALGTVAP